MANYFGKFRGLDTSTDTAGTLYCVYIIGDTSSTVYTEVMLAGSNPFIVNYDESKTPFEPVRTSTATISIVHNDYMQDILSPYAQGTQVKLYNETEHKYEWVGYLTPKLYDQSYENEYETIQLEAADCVSSLQYINYTDDTGYTKNIVTIKSIINKICDACGLLDGYYWTRSKKVGNTVVLPDALKISEQNFFSEDTDEPWKMDEMLEEICRYFGFTAMQWGTRLYFVDYQYYHNHDDIYATYYAKSSSYAQGSDYHIGGAKTLSQDDIMKNGADITFEPVYNKCVVKANFYDYDYFIPNIFDDSFLTNRNGDFYEGYEVGVPSPHIPTYPYGSKWLFFGQKFKEDVNKDNEQSRTKGDARYRYFHRLYDSKYWESVYRNRQTLAEVTPASMGTDYNNVYSTTSYIGGTLVDLGVVEDDYTDEYHQDIVASKLDFTRYLCICQRGKGGWINPFFPNQVPSASNYPVFRLKPGYKSICPLPNNSYLIVDFECIYERYVNRPYINPDWTTSKMKMDLSAGEETCAYAYPCFKLKIGDKYWNGSVWTTTSSNFAIPIERNDKDFSNWNEEKHPLNTVNWQLNINEDGYKIPLTGVDTTGEIEFEILLPELQYYNSHLEDPYAYNAYCWFKNLSIKAVQTKENVEEKSGLIEIGNEDNDIVYENVIDEDAVNEISDITVKLTTSTGLTSPSYSNVIYGSALLTTITEPSLSGEAQKPEENIVEKYVLQYNTPTKKIQTTTKLDITPFNKIYSAYVDNPDEGYVQLSTEIDYSYARQTITLVEKK